MAPSILKPTAIICVCCILAPTSSHTILFLLPSVPLPPAFFQVLKVNLGPPVFKSLWPVASVFNLNCLTLVQGVFNSHSGFSFQFKWFPQGKIRLHFLCLFQYFYYTFIVLFLSNTYHSLYNYVYCLFLLLDGKIHEGSDLVQHLIHSMCSINRCSMKGQIGHFSLFFCEVSASMTISFCGYFLP